MAQFCIIILTNDKLYHMDNNSFYQNLNHAELVIIKKRVEHFL
jgi:hypothetical protein